MLNYKELLLTTYAEENTSLAEDGEDFVYTIHNPEWEGGDAVITCKAGALSLSFATMHEDFAGDFGALVALLDEILLDESMVFEIYSHGEDLLGGCRGTDEIDIDHSIPAFVRSLCEGDHTLYHELQAIIGEGKCYAKLRGWRKERNRSIILS